MEIKWIDYSLDTVMRYFITGFKPDPPCTIESFDYFVDTSHDRGKGRVVFRLFCRHEDEVKLQLPRVALPVNLLDEEEPKREESLIEDEIVQLLRQRIAIVKSENLALRDLLGEVLVLLDWWRGIETVSRMDRLRAETEVWTAKIRAALGKE